MAILGDNSVFIFYALKHIFADISDLFHFQCLKNTKIKGNTQEVSWRVDSHKINKIFFEEINKYYLKHINRPKIVYFIVILPFFVFLSTEEMI